MLKRLPWRGIAARREVCWRGRWYNAVLEAQPHHLRIDGARQALAQARRRVSRCTVRLIISEGTGRFDTAVVAGADSSRRWGVVAKSGDGPRTLITCAATR
jgi:hypothetical protein